ncbi:unnamed protein product [Diatraea saccharalis]|nr:unnamed protein product [Diatraea saccharalis]
MQQMQQQMMLCPVRVVYETQILVQPGEQIQPNQTLFINPQNPPPWAQNRQIQNQVLYVQQMPNNIISSVPQHIDQNQFYLQQYQNYQQVIPQQILAQNQEQRHMQIQNIMPQNMVQNLQANIGGNMPNLPDRIPQTFGAIPNVGQTMQLTTQTQSNIPTSNVNRSETNIQIVQQPQQSQRQEVRPVFMNINQPNQQQMRPPPQILTVNPIQNVPQPSTNYQAMPLNSIPRSIQTHSVGSQMSPPTFATSQPRIRKVAPTTLNKFTSTNIGARGMSQTYRPIQPRPQQLRNSAPSYTNSIEVPVQPNKPMQNGPNIININSTLPSMPNLQANIPNSSITLIRPEDQTNFKKRKSESPDEIHRKMAAIQVNITTPMKPVTIPQRNLEYTPNVNNMQKVDQKPNITIIPQPILPSNTETQAVEIKEISKLVENVQQAIQIDKCNAKTNPDTKDSLITEKDKLVRNTVFTQARGRVLTDKENANILKDTKNILKIEPESKVSFEIKQENIEAPVKSSTEEIKVDHKVENDTSITLKTPNNKGMLPVDRSTKQERDFVLTHVLDGIVIQESNVAFPIRDPAIRRTTKPTPQDCKTKIDPEDETRKNQTNIGEDKKTVSEIKDMPILNELETKPEQKTDSDNNVAPAPLVKTEEGITSHEKSDEPDNPFMDLQQALVKSWTIEQLSSHLTKFKWNETAALVMEHEIDGESIFLVSKTLLLNIGVKENHANTICAFINS